MSDKERFWADTCGGAALVAFGFYVIGGFWGVIGSLAIYFGLAYAIWRSQ